ncbi:MAG: CRISPR-associated endonuclease Cas2, partial [Candidatus Levybacteria bacterium]|nr:CRISPR-associated endonuclease Cas2 [Candidatus Levybacteria bacterium]
MKKLLRPQDILLLGLANVLDAAEEIKDPLGIMGKSYEQMYGFVPAKYKKHNFNHLVWRSIKTGYIEKVIKDDIPYLRLTSYGKKKIDRDFPLLKIQNSKWDRKWRIVTYDIEEISRWTREKFRKKLKELGFGMLQESVFITPNNIIKDFSEFVESLGLEDSVYILEVSQIVTGDVKSLANKIWHLDELNGEYVKIFEKAKLNNLISYADRSKKLNDQENINEIKNLIKVLRKDYLE